MGNGIYRWVSIALSLFVCLLGPYVYAQANYPYTSGQAVFVQSPYNSSLYTNYNYNARQGLPNRLPPYTTNQAVFVQQPYATAQQTVTSYPSSNYYGLPATESRYTSPTAYPSTVVPANPFAMPGPYTASPYATTNQYPTYQYPYGAQRYNSTELYPYTTSTRTVTYPTTTVQQVPVGSSPNVYSTYTYPGDPYSASYPTYPTTSTMQQARSPYSSNVYNAYPTTTIEQYPYPTTTTAVPERVIQPAPSAAPVPRSSAIYR